MTVAVAMPALALITCVTAELVEISSAQSRLQTFVDAAALKGAKELGVDVSNATSERSRAYADGQADDLRRRWTVTTTARADTGRGTMTVEQNATRSSFFGNLLPPGGFRIGATATATLFGGMPLCVLASASGATGVMSLGGSSMMTADKCLVQSNADLKTSGSSRVSAGAVRTVGGASGSIAPTPVTDAPAIQDPFADLKIAIPNRCDDVIVGVPGGTTTINPGVHCGVISLAGQSRIVLNPGEHYFVGGSLTVGGNVEITGTDVVLIFGGQSATRVTGNATLSLEGRRTGPYAGFVLVTDRNFSGELDISASNAKKLLGTIYVPNGTLAVSGNNNKIADQSPWTVVVAKKLAITQSVDLTINSNYYSSNVPLPHGSGTRSRLVR